MNRRLQVSGDDEIGGTAQRHRQVSGRDNKAPIPVWSPAVMGEEEVCRFRELLPERLQPTSSAPRTLSGRAHAIRDRWLSREHRAALRQSNAPQRQGSCCRQHQSWHPSELRSGQASPMVERIHQP